MNDMVVTQYWMFGVMGIMIAYGVCAVIGTLKSK